VRPWGSTTKAACVLQVGLTYFSGRFANRQLRLTKPRATANARVPCLRASQLMTDDEINLATGVVMQRYDIDADAARSLLMRLSRHYQHPVIDIARRLIAEFPAPPTKSASRAQHRQPGSAIAGFSGNENIHVQIATLIHDVHEREPGEMAAVLDELTATAARYVPGAQYAGITAIDHHGRIDISAVARDYPGLLDVIQERHQEGPCLQAVREHDTVRVDDLTSDIRWPRYRRDALAQTPIGSMLSCAMYANGNTLGALNVYAEHPHSFGAESEDLGFIYATHATLAWNALRRATQFGSRAQTSRSGPAQKTLTACGAGSLPLRSNILHGP
jgi:putative methionine-R-sulfoxide reductase with GAF domain